MASAKKPVEKPEVARKTGKTGASKSILTKPRASAASQTPAAPAKRQRTDWDAVERDYRTGKFTLRELAAKYELTHSAIGQKARKLGWTADLTQAIRQATNAKLIAEVVSKEVSSATQSVSTVVLAAAEINKQIILGHRNQIAQVRATVESARDKVLALGSSVADIKEASALAGAAESLTRSYKNLIEMERKAFRLDEEETPESELAAMSDEDLDLRTEKLLERHRSR